MCFQQSDDIHLRALVFDRLILQWIKLICLRSQLGMFLFEYNYNKFYTTKISYKIINLNKLRLEDVVGVFFQQSNNSGKTRVQEQRVGEGHIFWEYTHDESPLSNNNEEKILVNFKQLGLELISLSLLDQCCLCIL